MHSPPRNNSFQRYRQPSPPERVFTLLSDGEPILTFAAVRLAEARQLCTENWVREDLKRYKSRGKPLWDGSAKITVRQAAENEIALYQKAAVNKPPEDELLIAFLAELESSS